MSVSESNEKYTIRRKFLKVFGAAFHVFDEDGSVVGYCKQKAFKLKEDIRLYTGEDMRDTLLVLQAKSVIDFGATYTVALPDGAALGSLRRKGLKSSFVRDEWLVFDQQNNEIARIREKGSWAPLVRRYVDFASVLMPQRFEVIRARDGKNIATLRQHFNLFIYRLGVAIEEEDDEIDDLLILRHACWQRSRGGRSDQLGISAAHGTISSYRTERSIMDTNISRRNAISGLAAMGAAGLVGTRASAAGTASHAAKMPESLGWDEITRKYVLPPLPYAYDALDDVIDEQTMRIHHEKHHAGYVRGANNALEKLEAIRRGSGDELQLEYWEKELSFNMGGHINHTLFWYGMKPSSEASGQPTGKLLNMIEGNFGSFRQFTDQFISAASKVEGSGWGWLVYEPTAKRLMVVQTLNQQKLLFAGVVPLLGVDVWEHAYYLKYQNRRSDYVKAFMSIIDWDEVHRRLEHAMR